MIKRIFTLQDDELIIRHARGEFGIRALQYSTKSSRRTLEERAKELGVSVRSRAPRGTTGRSKLLYERQPDDGKNYTFSVGPEDLLLKALHQHHPDRRYNVS